MSFHFLLLLARAAYIHACMHAYIQTYMHACMHAYRIQGLQLALQPRAVIGRLFATVLKVKGHGGSGRVLKWFIQCHEIDFGRLPPLGKAGAKLRRKRALRLVRCDRGFLLPFPSSSSSSVYLSFSSSSSSVPPLLLLLLLQKSIMVLAVHI
jgi:hypothetical protein